MNRFASGIAWIALIFCANGVFADQELTRSLLIDETRALRKEVSPEDPVYSNLSLRLADLLFEAALEIGMDFNAAPADLKKRDQYRNESIALYQEVIGPKGPEGADHLSVELRDKVVFQLGRSLSDAQSSKAIPYWRFLYQNSKTTKLIRESALRLAEVFEQSLMPESQAAAEKLYTKAIELCEGDICSFSHFKRAWTMKRQSRLGEAIDEMKLALWDKAGRLRRESLRDLLNFYAADPSETVATAVEVVKTIESRVKDNSFLEQLSDSYFSVGESMKAVAVLSIVNERTPKLFYEARLAEESYGSRDWDGFHARLLALQKRDEKDAASLSEEEHEKVQKWIRRLTVQLDAERQTRKESIPEFLRSVIVYLQIFPTAKDRRVMEDGWLAAEKDSLARVDQLKKWIDWHASEPVRQKELREFRIAAAQKIKRHDVVEEEVAQLLVNEKLESKRRELQFIRALALLNLKREDEALDVFQKLAQLNNGIPDEWATKALDQSLGILNERKDWQAVVKQISLWTQDEKFVVQPAWAVKRAKLNEVRLKARFEYATALGSTPEALAIFNDYCGRGIYTNQACENAKVLAVRLNDQATLIGVLEKTGQKKALAYELERSARFADAAALFEKVELNHLATAKDYLKVALLYELGGKRNDQKRVLAKLRGNAAFRKEFSELEPLIYQTYLEAGLLNANAMKWPWSEANRQRLAEKIYADSKDKRASKLILSSKKQTGSAWKWLVWNELEKQYEKQAKIDITGRNSRRKFNWRVSLLKKLVTTAQIYIEGADSTLRLRIAGLLEKAHLEFAQTIKDSPLPKELSEEELASIKSSLGEMAAPFESKAVAYKNLYEAELARAGTPELRSEWIKVSQDPLSAPAPEKGEAVALGTLVQDDLLVLSTQPDNTQALERIEKALSERGGDRLAGYFKGRRLSLNAKETAVEGKQ